MGITYRDSGVDIEEGDRLVERIAPVAKRTMRPEVLAGIGGFASMVRIPAGYREPILVSGTDGVGTKLKLAFLTGRHDTIGQDLVAMCVNDVVVTGAEPLFFLDYFASGKLDAGVATTVVAGIADGCKLAGCALVGGETAELPGFYADGEYDLAGFCVGVVEKDQALDGKRVEVGDAVIGLASTGLHSNGYSLARKVVLEALGLSPDDRPAELGGATVGDALLAPTRIYVGVLLGLRKAGIDVRAAAHITGGGLPGNLPRTLPDGVRAVLDAAAWKPAPIYDLLRKAVDPAEMLQTFNCGLGFTVVVPPAEVDRAIAFLATRGVAASKVGTIEAGEGEATCVVEGWR